MNVYVKAALVAAGVYYFTRNRSIAQIEQQVRDNMDNGRDSLDCDMRIKIGPSINADRGQDKAVTVVINATNNAETGESVVLSDVKVVVTPANSYNQYGFDSRTVTITIPNAMIAAGETKTITGSANYYGAQYSGLGTSSAWYYKVNYTVNGIEYEDIDAVSVEA